MISDIFNKKQEANTRDVELKELKNKILYSDGITDLSMARIGIAELQSKLHRELVCVDNSVSATKIKGCLNILKSYEDVLKERFIEVKKSYREGQRIDYNFRQLSKIMLDRTKYNEILRLAKNPKKQSILELKDKV